MDSSVAGEMTHFRTFSIVLALPNSGHSFIGSAIARRTLGMTKIGTLLPFQNATPNGESCQEPPLNFCPTSIAVEDELGWKRTGGFGIQRRQRGAPNPSGVIATPARLGGNDAW